MVWAMSEVSSGTPPAKPGPGSVLGSSMTRWVLELQRLGLHEAARAVDQDKTAELQELDRLGCPHYQRQVTAVEAFLNEPAASFERLQRERYFVILSPRSDRLERFREGKLTQPAIPGFVRAKL